jgi:CRP-like cAMP-binding protein
MANSAQSPPQIRNAILSRLPAAQLAELRRSLQPVPLEVPQPIYEPNQLIRYAYFPEGGMISVVVVMGDGSSIEVGTIGREGCAGGGLLLEADRAPNRYFVQAEGQALRIDAERFKQEAERLPDLRKLVLRYEAALLGQSMQGMACNGLHSVQQRCCRWLLMARDRSDSDELSLTHEFLAYMLGVRRASVSDVLGPLQDAELVRSTRGRITILNRAGLENGTCECYRIITEQQNQLLDC